MAEAKKKPSEQAEAPRVVGVTYMMVPTGERTGDIPLFAVRRVEFDGQETRSSIFEAVKPAPRLVIRERLRILIESREVMP